jgi:predicted N-acetyltransferase YhbS
MVALSIRPETPEDVPAVFAVNRDAFGTQYYPRFGFQPASRWGIRPPFEVAEEVFMAYELVPGALDDCAGVVEYPAAFDDP